MHNTIRTDTHTPRNSRSEKNTSPFLAKAGTPRTGDDQLPGYYSEEEQMWVVDTAQGTQPIINEPQIKKLMTTARRASCLSWSPKARFSRRPMTMASSPLDFTADQDGLG